MLYYLKLVQYFCCSDYFTVVFYLFFDLDFDGTFVCFDGQLIHDSLVESQTVNIKRESLFQYLNVQRLPMVKDIYTMLNAGLKTPLPEFESTLKIGNLMFICTS